ncbi:hypothetical protein CSUI_003029 [Cystoisospora suis]|uniref:Transmembrane protein n=1 Tax=Cystoisospora suis TaxID=483139 RepID=A0A2C6L6K5_9APIC|nr:hypothetical protein CSUI_003029 [Cystoisospora suis]
MVVFVTFCTCARLRFLKIPFFRFFLLVLLSSYGGAWPSFLDTPVLARKHSAVSSLTFLSKVGLQRSVSNSLFLYRVLMKSSLFLTPVVKLSLSFLTHLAQT